MQEGMGKSAGSEDTAQELKRLEAAAKGYGANTLGKGGTPCPPTPRRRKKATGRNKWAATVLAFTLVFLVVGLCKAVLRQEKMKAGRESERPLEFHFYMDTHSLPPEVREQLRQTISDTIERQKRESRPAEAEGAGASPAPDI